MKKFTLKIAVDEPGETVASLLVRRSGLSATKVKDAMNKGAAWIKRDRKMKRLRRASSPLHTGDCIEFHYDERLLEVIPPEPALVSDEGSYSVWFKPAGLLAQGTKYGDHCSLLRKAELFFRNSREVYLVHRLDREASGLMLIAHHRQAAARLSEIFRENRVVKQYEAEVLGDLPVGTHGTIELPIDGAPAKTDYEVISYDPSRNVSSVDVKIVTGRLHQIRRHFEMIGHPVMGDPVYGRGNKNREGLRLTAVFLGFRCPFRRRDVQYSLTGPAG